MQLEGYDMEIKGTTNITEFDFILRWILKYWPLAVFQAANSEKASEIKSEALPVFTNEFFIFLDRKNFASWTRNGLTCMNADKMISFYFETDYIGAVVEAPGSKTHDIVNSLEEVILNFRKAI